MSEEREMTERELKIKAMVDRMAKPGDFILVDTDELEEYDMFRDSEAMVAATQPVPYDEEDIYNLRLHVVLHPVVDDHVDPTKFIMLDPKYIRDMPSKRFKELSDMFVLDFQTPKPTEDDKIN